MSDGHFIGISLKKKKKKKTAGITAKSFSMVVFFY